MDQLVHAINEQQPEIGLQLKNFEVTGTPHATFTVLHKEAIEEAEKRVKHDYEGRIAALEGNQKQLLQLVSKLIGQPNIIINHITNQLSLTGEIGMSNDTYNVSQAGVVGRYAQANNVTFQQIVRDLSKLKEEMQAQATTSEEKTAAEEVVRAEQAAHDGDQPKMMGHLKNAGKWALKKAEDIGTKIAVEVIKDSMGL